MVCLVTQPFEPVFSAHAHAKGMPSLRRVVMPHFRGAPAAERARLGYDIADTAIGELTRPLTAEEIETRPAVVRTVRDVGTSERVIFRGSFEEVNRFCLGNKLTDGLPIVPPTEEAAARMLAAIDRSPGEVVAVLEPSLGAATIEKIAINAVMAGARPEYMPVITASVEAIAEPAFNLHTTAVSTASTTPCVVVSGQIARDLNINSGAGCLGPGWQANATIGRTLRLILMNIAGAYPGDKDMGGFGHPGRYSMVMAEAEDKSPWAPLRVDLGFSRESSTVTVFPVHDYKMGPGLTPSDSQTGGAKAAFVKSLTAQFSLSWHPFRLGSPRVLLLTPHVASSLAREGWAKEDLRNMLYEQARCSVGEIPRERIIQAIKAGLASKWVKDLPPESTIPVATSADRYVIIVGGFEGAVQPVIMEGMHGDMVTKEIRRTT